MQERQHSGDSAPPVFQYCIPFRVETLFKFTTRGGISVVPSLSGYISGRLWWKRSKCAKITRHERCREHQRNKKILWQWRRWRFSLAANFPRQITVVRRPKDRAHRITKRGGGGEGHQIAQFPIRSLAEIWNNNPHQGLATSVMLLYSLNNGEKPSLPRRALKSAGESFSSHVFLHYSRLLSTVQNAAAR